MDRTAHFIRSDTVDYEGGNNSSDASSAGSNATDDIVDNCKNKSDLGVEKHFQDKEFELGGARNIKQRRNPAVEDFDEFEQKAKNIDDAYDEKLASLRGKFPKVMDAIEEHRREEAESREEAERLTALLKEREAIKKLTTELTKKEGKNKRKFDESFDKQEKEYEQESKHRKVDQQSSLDYVLEKNNTEMPDIFDMDGGE